MNPITLIDARERAELSQTELARVAGVPRGTLYNWEAGRCLPSDTRFSTVTAVLQVRSRRVVLG